MKFLKIFSKTDIGKKRENNEDSVISIVIHSRSFNKELNCGILVVADGIGGFEKGEVASEIATKKFIKEVTEKIYYNSNNCMHNEFGEILIQAVEAANDEIRTISKRYSIRIGTTITGAIIVDKKSYIVNVGDSRAYLIKPNTSIVQITKDHSIVQEMLDNKEITNELVKNHPRRNILTKALGLSESVMPDIFIQNIENATLLLCSDGLYNMLDDDEIFKTVNENIYQTADELISLANKKGGIDNISVAIARYNS